MLCENCGKREANVRYTENINGRRRELNLCEECSQKLGVGQMDFSMPIDFSSFLGGFMDELTTPSFMPMINTLKQNKCNNCGATFDDIIEAIYTRIKIEKGLNAVKEEKGLSTEELLEEMKAW